MTWYESKRQLLGQKETTFIESEIRARTGSFQVATESFVNPENRSRTGGILCMREFISKVFPF